MPMRRVLGNRMCRSGGMRGPLDGLELRTWGDGRGFSDGETRVFFATGSRARAPRASPGSGHHEEHRDEYRNVFRTD
jgi:hypothetical protein